MAGRSVAPASLLLLLLAALMGGGPRPPRAAAQMVSPLQGQGSPRPETRDVFVSVYLDRLLRGGWGWCGWEVVGGVGGRACRAHSVSVPACATPAAMRAPVWASLHASKHHAPGCKSQHARVPAPTRQPACPSGHSG